MENSKKEKMSRYILVGVLSLAAILVVIIIIFNPRGPIPAPQLPYIGNDDYDTVRTASGAFRVDTIHHSVQDFSFTDQNGKTITQNTFKGKIYVADFFFTTCKNICPIMTTQLRRVAQTYKNEPRVMLLSHTVNPEHDSVNVLAEYANLQNADSNQWHFVTGSKKEIYQMARRSYLLTTNTGDGGADDFVHTQMFALVDTSRHLRGVYDGTDSSDVKKLITDIGILLKAKK